MKKEKLKKLYEKMVCCEKCKLYKTKRKMVFGAGKPNSHIMLIGEAPGREENLCGKPFIGASGDFLTETFEEVGLKRDRIFITNIVKCRPTLFDEGRIDRKPIKKEMDACNEYLESQIAIINPKIIITVGNVPTQYLLKTKQGITSIHGEVFYYKNIPVIPMYHPSYILRNGGHKSDLKDDMLDDLKVLKRELIKILQRRKQK